MKTKEEIIKRFEETRHITNKFYLNGLLFCLDRSDLTIKVNTEKKVNEVLKELKNMELK